MATLAWPCRLFRASVLMATQAWPCHPRKRAASPNTYAAEAAGHPHPAWDRPSPVPMPRNFRSGLERGCSNGAARTALLERRCSNGIARKKSAGAESLPDGPWRRILPRVFASVVTSRSRHRLRRHAPLPRSARDSRLRMDKRYRERRQKWDFRRQSFPHTTVLYAKSGVCQLGRAGFFCRLWPLPAHWPLLEAGTTIPGPSGAVSVGDTGTRNSFVPSRVAAGRPRNRASHRLQAKGQRLGLEVHGDDRTARGELADDRPGLIRWKRVHPARRDQQDVHLADRRRGGKIKRGCKSRADRLRRRASVGDVISERRRRPSAGAEESGAARAAWPFAFRQAVCRRR